MRWNSTDRFAISERRCERFFGSAGKPDYGICAHFERIGDQLHDMHAIARVLADRVTGGYDTIIEHFRFSVKAGRFGPSASSGRFAAPEALSYNQRRRVYNLIDLYSAVSQVRPEPGQYALRPSVLIADIFARDMRARQSTWAHWIAGQGWPVPPEFRAPVIDTTIDIAASRALPAPEHVRRNKGGRPPKRREAVVAWYNALSANVRERGTNQGLAESYVTEHGGNKSSVENILRNHRKIPTKSLA